MEASRAMEEIQQQGGVIRIGISNCYELGLCFELISDEAIIKPTLLQNRFYSQTSYDKKLRKWCNEKNISYQAFWTLTANPNILNNPILYNIAKIKQVTVEQLFFRFLTEQKIIPLIGTCSEKHMQEDLAIFKFTLTDDEMGLINTLIGCSYT